MKKLFAGVVIFALLMSLGTAVFAYPDDGYTIGRNSIYVGK